MFLAILAGLALASFLLTGAVRRCALRIGLFDVPVARSLHEHATPVGGGIAFAALFLVFAGGCWWAGVIPGKALLALGGSGLVAAVGLCDDLWKLPLGWRLATQFAAAIWAVFWLGAVAPVDLLLFEIGDRWLLQALAAFALVWLLNLYNFMDGIDGLAASELVFVNAMAVLFAVLADDAALGVLSAGLGATGLGFLFWNWPPARIFMGDAGSNFLGFTLGVFALLSMAHGSMSVWTWLLLLGVFVTDASVTLLRRIARGERWFEGHCCHAYQHMALRWGSHRRVTLAVLALNGCWLSPLAWWSLLHPQWGMALALAGLAPLVLLSLRLGAGVERKLGAAPRQS